MIVLHSASVLTCLRGAELVGVGLKQNMSRHIALEHLVDGITNK
jgi:hypothetical protein